MADQQDDFEERLQALIRADVTHYEQERQRREEAENRSKAALVRLRAHLAHRLGTLQMSTLTKSVDVARAPRSNAYDLIHVLSYRLAAPVRSLLIKTDAQGMTFAWAWKCNNTQRPYTDVDAANVPDAFVDELIYALVDRTKFLNGQWPDLQPAPGGAIDSVEGSC